MFPANDIKNDIILNILCVIPNYHDVIYIHCVI